MLSVEIVVSAVPTVTVWGARSSTNDDSLGALVAVAAVVKYPLALLLLALLCHWYLHTDRYTGTEQKKSRHTRLRVRERVRARESVGARG